MTAGLRLTLLLCGMQVLALSGWLSFQALIPMFRELWSLTNAEAGWVAAVSYLTYASFAPLLTALTDRLDARKVVIAGCGVSFFAALGFGLLADGFWSAILFRALTGIGIAGSYMPGLKALSDRLEPEGQGRFQSFYTASFSLGSALSLFATAFLAELFGWRGAFIGVGLLGLSAGLVALVALRPKAPPMAPGTRLLFDPRPVLRDRRALAYIIAYAAHAFEMAAFRTWIVAFLLFASLASGSPVDGATAAAIATALVMIGLPASIGGNELASRFSRTLVLTVIMTASAAFAVLLGLVAHLPFPLVVAIAALYACLVMADSAAITVGTLAQAPMERRGTAIATQTLLASVMAMASPLLVGYALDWAGDGNMAGWVLGFAIMGLGVMAGPVAFMVLARPAKP